MESSYLYGFVGIGGPWVKFLGFYLGFGYMKFQTTNTSVVVWFWMNSMLVLEVLWNREVV